MSYTLDLLHPAIKVSTVRSRLRSQPSPADSRRIAKLGSEIRIAAVARLVVLGEFLHRGVDHWLEEQHGRHGIDAVVHIARHFGNRVVVMRTLPALPHPARLADTETSDWYRGDVQDIRSHFASRSRATGRRNRCPSLVRCLGDSLYHRLHLVHTPFISRGRIGILYIAQTAFLPSAR